MRFSARLQAVLLSAAVFTGCCALVPVFASGTSPISPSAYRYAAEHSQQLPDQTDSQAAMAMPHEDLSRNQVLNLLGAVFAVPLEGPVGPLANLEVDRFLSSHAAVVSPATPDEAGGKESGQGPQVLLESDLPIATTSPSGTKEAIDLNLEFSQTGFSPESPLVDLDLPAELSEGVHLPELDITVTPQMSADDRQPSILNDTTAVYPNIQEDVDFVAVPTATGVETFTTLRSPGSPTSHVLHLDLPSGAVLEQDGLGAKISQGEKDLLRVLPPTAIDAAGRPVPVTLTASGSSIRIDADPPEDAAWPILVDPIFEVFPWYYAGGAPLNINAWTAFKSSQFFNQAFGTHFGGSYHGMYIGATPAQYQWGDSAEWLYKVPRYESERSAGRYPKSYIARMDIGKVIYMTSPGPSSPYVIAGIWDVAKQNWVGKTSPEAFWAYPGNGLNVGPLEIKFENGTPGQRSEKAQIGVGLALWANQNANLADLREAYVGGVTIEVADDEKPKTANGAGPLEWIDASTTTPITAEASDYGLGVKSVRFALPGQSAVTKVHPCIGTAEGPCPNSLSSAIQPSEFDESKLPQGFVNVPIVAKDVVGNETATELIASAELNVDHANPTIALDGTITKQAQLGTNLPEYALNYNATDGDETAAAPLSSFGGSGTAAGKTELPIGVAVEANGNVLVVDRANKRVSRFDPNGTYLNQFGTPGTGNGQINDPTGIALAENGNIWVVEMANARIQAFSPTGQFVRSITCPCFSQPYAISTGPSQALWISDIGKDTIYKYREDGTKLLTVKGTAASPSGGATETPNVTGMATDADGNLWAVDFLFNIVQKFDVNGKYVTRFGTYGTGDGQLTNPGFVTIAPSGNLIVVDYNNSRLQEFMPDGTYLRKFGSFGSGLGQMNAPQGPDFGPNGILYVPDYSNHRINRWTHADFNPQSGVRKVEIKVDGQAVRAPDTQGCAKTCSLSGAWTLDADEYPVGQHSLEVVATDGVGRKATAGPLTIETHGDRKDPSVALSGSLTEQATLGNTRPRYVLKVNASDPGSTGERQSGVASTTISVAGDVVDSASPGCPGGGCSLVREWTLNASTYSPGTYPVEVTATDGAGRKTTKHTAVTIVKDTTPPSITIPAASDSFYNAPEGWVLQVPYLVNATGKDDSGHGATSITLKIDGETIRSQSQECSFGGCSVGLGNVSVDMADYEGGAHEAELIVSDGAGNAARRQWSINIDPHGSVPAGESTATLEAVEATEPEAELVATTTEVVELPGTGNSLDPKLEEVGSTIESTGVPVSTSIDAESGAITIEGTDGPITLEPGQSELSGEPEVANQSAAVAPTASGVDAVVRPIYNGAMVFAAIRDPNATQEFRWQVKLNPGQTIEAVDGRSVSVAHPSGRRAMLIVAEDAHDATGRSVPTTLALEGTEVVLTVNHTSETFAYPVIAGTSYETGYSSVLVIDEVEAEEVAAEEEADPPSPAEIAEMLSYTSSSPPLNEKQLRRLSRKRVMSEVTAPLSLSGTGIRTFKLYRKMCQIDACDVWHVQFTGGTFLVIGKGEKGTHVETNGSEVNCNSSVAWPLQRFIEIDIFAEGTHLPPREAWYGEGKHLTYFCKVHIDVEGNVPYVGIPGGIRFRKHGLVSLMTWVYHNGYQERAIRPTDCPLDCHPVLEA